MKFTADLESRAHHTTSGEYAWRRADAREAVLALSASGRALLGGELWLVHDGQIWGILPQRSGPPAVYHWECEQGPSESWGHFVERSCSESLAAIAALPAEGEIDAPPGGEVYYNLTWLAENE